jgi:hypothetical protein
MAISSRNTGPQEPFVSRGSMPRLQRTKLALKGARDRLARILRHQKVLLVYLLLGIFAGGVGFWLLPAKDSLYAAPSLGITIYQGERYENNEDNNSVRVRVTSGPSGSSKVELTVISPDPATQAPPPNLTTRIVFPRDTVFQGCPRSALKPPYKSDFPQCLQKVILRYSAANGRWEATQSYTVEKPASVVLATGNDAVEGALPQVDSTKQLDSIHVSVGLSDALRYSWIGGPPPNEIQADQLRWVLDADQARTGTQPVAAVDRSAQYNNNVWTLLAGIAFGLAGSAWFTAIQEVIPGLVKGDPATGGVTRA